MLSNPYALLSDIHGHAWSAYSSKLPGGVNSRLQIIVDEINRAAVEQRAAGGKTLVLAGDLFHTRGSIDPEVFNPISDVFKALIADGYEVVALVGNHDLKSNESTALGNSFQSFRDVNGFHVVTKADLVDVDGQSLLMVPWIPRLDDLKAELEKWAESTTIAHGSAGLAEVDVIMHAGIDGVLSGMPAHGLTPDYLAGLGYRRVFAGHYHHHAVFETGKVISIGATTHQTFSDIGTRAGFLLVYPDRIVYRASHAPSFIDVSDETDPDEIPLIVPGNYVRVRGFKLDDAGVSQMRKELEKLGAAGITFQTERETISARTGGSSAKGVSLENSIAGFIKRMSSPHETAVNARAAQILSQVRAATE